MLRLPSETVCSSEAFSLLLTLSWSYTKLLSTVNMVFIHKMYKENTKKQPLIFWTFLHIGCISFNVGWYDILHIALPKAATLHITQPIRVLWALTRVGRKSWSSAYCISQLVSSLNWGENSAGFYQWKRCFPCYPCEPWPPRTGVTTKDKGLLGFLALDSLSEQMATTGSISTMQEMLRKKKVNKVLILHPRSKVTPSLIFCLLSDDRGRIKYRQNKCKISFSRGMWLMSGISSSV